MKKWMPQARRCQYRTAHRRRPGAVATCEVEKWALFCLGLAEQKRVRELLTQSRELLKQMQAG
jgi:hypothetical protein